MREAVRALVRVHLCARSELQPQHVFFSVRSHANVAVLAPGHVLDRASSLWHTQDAAKHLYK